MNPTQSDVSENVRDDKVFREEFLSPRRFFVLLLIYFTLQTVIRVLLSGTVDLDESEQLILTQKFAWGYGSQPPLYTWLQMLFFKCFGVSIFALALLKNLLLFSIYAFTYFNTRLITGNSVCAMLAATSLLFIPQVAWESQRDLTHSVLASALVMATLFVFLRLRETNWRDYAVLGLCVGLGILSKYNYAAFFFGLIFSALTVPRFRSVVLNRRILISLIVCLAVLLPHLFWAMKNPESLTTASYKFHQQEEGKFISGVASGLGKLLLSVFFHIAPAVGIFAAIFRKPVFSKATSTGRNYFAQFFIRQYGFILAGLVLAVLLLRVTDFKDRWHLPIFISLPTLLFAVAQKWIEPFHAKQILTLGSVVALVVLILIPGRIIFAEKIGRPQPLNAPFSQMKNRLREKIPSDALVLAENKWLGGNLRLQFPEQNVVTPELAKLFSARKNSVVVRGTVKGDSPKSAFAEFLKSFSGIEITGSPPTFLTERYQYFSEKEFRVGIVPALDGKKDPSHSGDEKN